MKNNRDKIDVCKEKKVRVAKKASLVSKPQPILSVTDKTSNVRKGQHISKALEQFPDIENALIFRVASSNQLNYKLRLADVSDTSEDTILLSRAFKALEAGKKRGLAGSDGFRSIGIELLNFSGEMIAANDVKLQKNDEILSILTVMYEMKASFCHGRRSSIVFSPFVGR